MTIQEPCQKESIASQTTLTPLGAAARLRPERWDERIASLISYAGSPPVLVAFTMLLSDAKAWFWSVVYLLVAVLLPVMRLVWLVKRGFITDLDVQLRKQRIGPLSYTLIFSGLAWGLLALGGAPPLMRALAAALWVLEALILIITLRWKISVHSAMAGAAAWMIWHELGLVWIPLTGVMLIVWSRLHLQRHTALQTLAGATLGATVFRVVISIITG